MDTIVMSNVYMSLILAMILGMILGMERFLAHKTAGMRTYALISIGSAMFVIISQIVVGQSNFYNFDPMRIAAQVVAASGFLGVGAIFHNDQKISGITTASGLWVSAGIGMACGFGLYKIAFFVTLLALVVFVALWFIEKKIRNIPGMDKEINSL